MFKFLLHLGVALPVLVFLIFRPRLNRFFKLLLYTQVVGVMSEIIAEFCAKVWKNNIPVYTVYTVICMILLSLMWQSKQKYGQRDRNFLTIVAAVLSTGAISTLAWYGPVTECINIVISGFYLAVFIFPIHYLYKLIASEKNDLTKETPYLIVAAAFVLQALASSSLMVARALTPVESIDLITNIRLGFIFLHSSIICWAFIYIWKNPESI